MFIDRTGGEEMQNRGTRSSISANGCISVRVFQKETGNAIALIAVCKDWNWKNSSEKEVRTNIDRGSTRKPCEVRACERRTEAFDEATKMEKKQSS